MSKSITAPENEPSYFENLPDYALIRASRIHNGNGKNKCPLLDIAPSTFFAGVKKGLYPKPLKIGGCTFWKLSEIKALADSNEKEASK